MRTTRVQSFPNAQPWAEFIVEHYRDEAGEAVLLQANGPLGYSPSMHLTKARIDRLIAGLQAARKELRRMEKRRKKQAPKEPKA